MAHGGAGNGGVEIGVVQDDVGRFAAEFERNFFQVAGGGVQDQLADFGGAGEGDFVHVGMRGESGAGGFAVARDDVDDAIGESGFLKEFAEAKRGERRLLGGLQNYGAAGGERGAEFPGGHQEREIPGNDLADDADGFAHGVGEKASLLGEAAIGMVLPSILVAQPA